ncbi:response regulator transcription factor [Roseomonas sp. 18066]|uniref:response regulator transcription factor n=1 Tax=Roseomonas sp. 18066 TaxID=2681412 RepID=UPI00190F860A|nr:response regulator [Roseomonas sp. 18066]
MITPLIAIVEDDRHVRTATASLLRAAGHASEGFASAEDFLSVDAGRFACVISDVQMPGRSGLELLALLAARGGPPVILMTAFPDPRLERQARAGGALDFLEKPCDPDRMLASLERALG